MRKTFFLLLCVLVGFSAFSKATDSREIDLRAKQSDQEALRCILPVRASLDGNTLLVEFFSSPQEVTVKISSLENQEVITEVYIAPELIRMPITGKSGNYSLDIIYEDTHLSGEFLIE